MQSNKYMYMCMCMHMCTYYMHVNMRMWHVCMCALGGMHIAKLESCSSASLKTEV